MSEKRKSNHHDGGSAGAAKKKRYMGGRGGAQEIRGPGMWITCDRRKEAKTVTEAYDILNEAADRLYPRTEVDGTQNDDDGDDAEESIEDQIARELQSIQGEKGKGKKNTARFTSVKTDVECLIWISFAPPIDPVALTDNIIEAVQNGAPIRTRHIQRLTPVTNTAHADADALRSLAYRVLQDVFAPPGYTNEQRSQDPMITYRIEPSLRNHSGKLNREVINQVVGGVIHDLTTASFQYPRYETEKPANTDSGNPEDEIAETALPAAAAADTAVATEEAPPPTTIAPVSAPQPQPVRKPILPAARRKTKVDLKNPTHTILISALKGICGMSIVTDYDKKRRLNLQMLANKVTEDKVAAAAIPKPNENIADPPTSKPVSSNNAIAVEAVPTSQPTEDEA